jgi:hypothetical protein
MLTPRITRRRFLPVMWRACIGALSPSRWAANSLVGRRSCGRVGSRAAKLPDGARKASSVKNSVGVGLILAAAIGVVGCSSDGSTPRPDGSAGAPVAMAGAGGGGAGQGGTSGGSPNSAGAAGAGGANVPDVTLGDVLEFVAGSGDIPYAIGPNSYGIVGGGFLARSVMGNTISVGAEPDKICIQGSLEEVPSGNYGQYWGVEFGFNLNQAAPVGGSGSSTPADAGADASADAAVAADASAPAEVARPWVSSTVIGFSYVIEGPSINLVRFKALPAGFNRSLESSVYCKTSTRRAVASKTRSSRRCGNIAGAGTLTCCFRSAGG